MNGIRPHGSQPEAGRPQLARASAGFSDELGDRFQSFDSATGTLVETLRLRREFADAPSFELALRERVERVGRPDHPGFTKVQSVKRTDAGLLLVSASPMGRRLSELVPIDNGFTLAMDVIRRVTPALAALHEATPGTGHGALSLNRIVMMRDKRLIVVEHVLAPALQSLHWSRHHYNHLGLIVSDAVPVRFDPRTDLRQLGWVVLSLLLGRDLAPVAYPAQARMLLEEVRALHTPVNAAGLGEWLERALQLAPDGFASARDAERAFNAIAADESLQAAESAGSLLAFPSETNAPESTARPVAAPTPAPAPALQPATIAAPKPTPIAGPKPAPIAAPKPIPEPEFSDASAADPVFEAGRDVTRATPAVARPIERAPRAAAMPASAPTIPAPAPAAAVPPPAAPPAAAAVTAPVPALPSELRSEMPSELLSEEIQPAVISAPAPKVAAARGPQTRILIAPATWAAGAISVLAIAEGLAIISMLMRPAAPVQPPARPELSIAAAAPPLADPPVRVETPSPTPSPVRQRAVLTPAPVRPGATATALRIGGFTVTSRIELQVYKDGARVGSTSGPIAIAEGRHTLQFVNEPTGFRVTQVVNVVGGQLTPVHIAVPNGLVSINAVPWASVTIDGLAAGDTPLGNLSLAIGPHEFIFRHPEFGERRQIVMVKADGLTRVAQNFR